MPRSKNNPSFAPARLEAEMLKTVVELFHAPGNPNHDISFIADELQISDLKARKLLITAGERDGKAYYRAPLASRIQKLREEGKTLKEIEQIMQISHASVVGYVPFSRTIYSMRERSADAIRIQRYRDRQKLCREYMAKTAGLDKAAEEEILWAALVQLSGCIFRTSGSDNKPGVRFTYTIPIGEDGRPADEMKISGKEKSITKASMMRAYWKVKGQVLPDPKAIGGSRSSYLYPIFLRLGVYTRD